VRPFSIEIRITPRAGVLDPEGETIARALRNLGYEGVEEVRVGRLIRMRLVAGDAAAAEETVEKMCEELIANPLIEDHELRVEAEVAVTGGA